MNTIFPSNVICSCVAGTGLNMCSQIWYVQRHRIVAECRHSDTRATSSDLLYRGSSIVLPSKTHLIRLCCDTKGRVVVSESNTV